MLLEMLEGGGNRTEGSTEEPWREVTGDAVDRADAALAAQMSVWMARHQKDCEAAMEMAGCTKRCVLAEDDVVSMKACVSGNIWEAFASKLRKRGAQMPSNAKTTGAHTMTCQVHSCI